MTSKHDFSAIESLDLDQVKAKLMHASGEGWSAARANAVEREYRRFLILAKKYPDEQMSPSVDVDTFWHYHILHTMKYAADCELAFGYFLHHFPHIGERGVEDAAALQHMSDRMRAMCEETFGEDDGIAAGESAYCGVAATEKAYCGTQAGDTAHLVMQATPAYYGVHARPAYCGVQAAPAYCGVQAAAAYCGVATRAEPAYCGVAAQRTPDGGAGADRRPAPPAQRPSLH